MDEKVFCHGQVGQQLGPLEVRLVWLQGVVHRTDVVQFSDEWVAATPIVLATMKIVVKAANEIYGPGTHWVEFRPAEALS